MDYTLARFKSALDWLQDTADLRNSFDAAAAEVFAALLADALESYDDDAQQALSSEASDFAVAASVAQFDLLLEELDF